MLKIEVDVAYPHYALNDCAELLTLVRHGLQEEAGPEAINAMASAIRAVETAMAEVVAFVNVAMRDDDGRVRPMADKGAHTSEPPPAAPRLTARAQSRPQAARG